MSKLIKFICVLNCFLIAFHQTFTQGQVFIPAIPLPCIHQPIRGCRWNSWSSWSKCNTTCSISEVYRTRSKLCYWWKTGNDCPGSSRESKKCGRVCCPENCIWGPWSVYGQCPVTCGNGNHTRSRSISKSAKCGGNPCSGPTTQTQQCSSGCCPVDCVWGQWSSYDKCSLTCGSGSQSRQRNITREASCGGAACVGPNTETITCNTQCCAVDCKWTNWSKFGSCSKSCASGLQSRQRQIATIASCHGKSCQGANNDSRSCNTECCKVDCSWTEWTAWQGCSATCGTGKQNRFRKIKVEASCGGDVCEGERVQIANCNTHCCPVDCQVSQWSSWTSCTKSCGVSGFTTRNRSITQQQSCNGKTCPDGFEQVKPCNVICFNNGTPDASAQTCQCSKGWKGGFCDEDVDECENNLNNCNDVATCTNLIGSFKCSCNQGYSGNGIECINDNECAIKTDLCHEDAICTDILGSYICTCANGYHGNGTICRDVDECGNGEHNCDVNANCFNIKGHYECLCKEGYKGDGLSCLDINECEENKDNCNSKAKCINIDGSFQCKCLEGFTGDGVTCSDVNECEDETNNCHSEANCNNLEGSFTCICKSGYRGNGLSCFDIDECLYELEDCNFNAACINTIGSYKCKCNSGYQGNGYNCSDIDECGSETHECHIEAICNNTIGGYSCTCNEGYKGNGKECTNLDECFEKIHNCSPNSVCLNYQKIISNTMFGLAIYLILY